MNISIFQVRKCRHKRIEECTQWRIGNSDIAWLQSVHILAMLPQNTRTLRGQPKSLVEAVVGMGSWGILKCAPHQTNCVIWNHRV